MNSKLNDVGGLKTICISRYFFFSFSAVPNEVKTFHQTKVHLSNDDLVFLKAIIFANQLF